MKAYITKLDLLWLGCKPIRSKYHLMCRYDGIYCPSPALKFSTQPTGCRSFPEHIIDIKAVRRPDIPRLIESIIKSYQ